MTSLPIRLSTKLMTFIPSLTFTELWVVSMEHLQWVWLASRERLPFRTPGSVPHFGTCYCSNCWDLFPINLPCLYSTFHLEYPLVLSRFCIVPERWDIVQVMQFLQIDLPKFRFAELGSKSAIQINNNMHNVYMCPKDYVSEFHKLIW